MEIKTHHATLSQAIREGAKLRPFASNRCRRQDIEPISVPNLRADGTKGFCGTHAYPRFALEAALERLQSRQEASTA